MQVSEEIKMRPNYKAYTDPKEARGRNYLPEPVGEEKPYILKAKADAPFDVVSVMSFTFHKALQSRPDQNGVRKDVCMVKYLADNQLEAVKLVASKKRIRRLDKQEFLYAIDMIEFEQLPPGDYAELMLVSQVPQVILASMKSPESAEEIKAQMEKLKEKLAEMEDAGKQKRQEEKKAEEAAQADEDEEQAKKKPKRRRR